MLQVYRDFCYETLAVPVVTGVKTPMNGLPVLKTPTHRSHDAKWLGTAVWYKPLLGQNFAKAF